MKNILLHFIAIFVFSFSGIAQTNVSLNIHHKLGESDFALYTASTNNLGNGFEAERLEYYLSEVSIVHDGGTVTNIEDLWILVNAAENTTVDLGNLDITSIEELSFYLGVDEAHNHLDPATYPSDHPLAPQNPSMHWGWVSGYRFIAMEGNSGNNMSQTFELHGLGDGNYTQVIIPLSLSAVDNAISIDIDADYNRGLENIDLSSGVIVHGVDGEAQEMIENFSKYVFSATDNTTATVDLKESIQLDIFPNPAIDNTTSLQIVSTENVADYQVIVSDALGRQIQFFDEVPDNMILDLNLESAGLYIVSLVKDGQTIISEKLIAN